MGMWIPGFPILPYSPMQCFCWPNLANKRFLRRQNVHCTHLAHSFITVNYRLNLKGSQACLKSSYKKKAWEMPWGRSAFLFFNSQDGWYFGKERCITFSEPEIWPLGQVTSKYQKRAGGKWIACKHGGLRNSRQISVFSPLDPSPQLEGTQHQTDWLP